MRRSAETPRKSSIWDSTGARQALPTGTEENYKKDGLVHAYESDRTPLTASTRRCGYSDQTRCGKRRANSRNAAIRLDSARARQSHSCFNNCSAVADPFALDRLQSALSSCRNE